MTSYRFIVASACALACHACVAGTPLDAGVSEAGRDAPGPTEDTGDRSVDASTDTSAADAHDGRVTDAPSTLGDPGWVHLTDAPDDCHYEVATHPENVTPGPVANGRALPWVDCGTGCRRTASSEYSPSDVFRAGGRTLAILGYTEDFVGPVEPVVRTVVDLDGSTTAAIRFQIDFSGTGVSCGTEHFGASGSDVAFEVDYARYDSTGNHVIEAWIRVYRGSFDGLSPDVPRVGEHVFAAGLGGGELVSAVGLGPHSASFDYVGSIFAITAGTTRVVSGALALHASPPFHVGDDVLFSGITSTTAPFGGVLARSVAGADATVIRSVSGGDLGVFGSDGTTLAWEEATGYDAATGAYAGRSLWSATYDGALHATRVRDMSASGVTHTAVGGGYFVQDEDDPTSGSHVYAIYRLSDGARATFDPLAAGGPAAAERVSFVAADELVLDTTGALWRVDPRTLTFVPP